MSAPAFKYRGLIVPVFTPISNDSARTNNLSLIPEYADYLAKKGVKGVLVNGTTGEGPSLSITERKLITEAWVNTVKKTKLHIMVQVGGAPLPDVIELAKHAESVKADSILCLPDLYFKPAIPEDLISYLQVVGAAAPKTPLLYYHIPALTNVNIHMGKCLQTLLRVGNVVPTFAGIKFTSNNLEEATQALLASSNRYALFLGSDQLIAAGCVLGMDSFIATSSNLFPKLTMEIIKAIESGDMLLARQKQTKLSMAVSLISSYGSWVQTMKVAMCCATPINVGPTRLPITDLPSDKVKSLQDNLQNLISKGGYE